MRFMVAIIYWLPIGLHLSSKTFGRSVDIPLGRYQSAFAFLLELISGAYQSLNPGFPSARHVAATTPASIQVNQLQDYVYSEIVLNDSWKFPITSNEATMSSS